MSIAQHLHITKQEARVGAIVIGALGAIAYVLHVRRPKPVIIQSDNQTGKPRELSPADLGPLPDFAGLDGAGIPYGMYGNTYDDAQTPPLYPDPGSIIDPKGGHDCGC